MTIAYIDSYRNTKLEWFWANILKGNYYILGIDIVASGQNLGIILEKKSSQKMHFTKKPP
jgi:hypothetical protein